MLKQFTYNKYLDGLQKSSWWYFMGHIGHHIVGPYFVHGNLNGESYLQLFIEAVDSEIT